MQKRKTFGRYIALFLSFVLIFPSIVSCELNSLIGEDSSDNASESLPEKESLSMSENVKESESTADSGEEIPAPLFFHPLTGESCTETQSVTRPLAFVIGNTNAGLPQSGLSLSEILIEAPIGTSETRLMMITTRYGEAEKIGAIRSATKSLAVLADSFRSVLVESGNADGSSYSHETSGATLSADKEANAFYKENGKLNPHNIYTNASRLQSAMIEAGFSKTDYGTPIFSFLKEDASEILSWNVATHVKVNYATSQCTEFRYASDTGLYTRYLNGIAQKDGSTLITCKNVLLLYCDSTVVETENEVSLSLALNGGSGVYATDGSYVNITWTRGENGSLILRKQSGEAISVNSGITHIQLVKSSQKSSVTLDCN